MDETERKSRAILAAMPDIAALVAQRPQIDLSSLDSIIETSEAVLAHFSEMDALLTSRGLTAA